MNINGKRVLLRAIELSDKDMLLKFINDQDLERNLGGWSFPVSDYNQEEWIKALKTTDKTFRSIIEVKDNHNAIGTAILTSIDYKNGTAEIHLKLIETIQGQGYGTEVVKLLVEYAFNELRLNCIYAHVVSYNKKSHKLFTKCGFKNEGTLRGRLFKNGDYRDICSFSIMKGDFHGDW